MTNKEQAVARMIDARSLLAPERPCAADILECLRLLSDATSCLLREYTMVMDSKRGLKLGKFSDFPPFD